MDDGDTALARPRRPGWARRVARVLYRVIRPVARPVGYRLRGFLMADAMGELAALRGEVAAVEARLREDPAQQTLAEIEALARSVEAALITLTVEARDRHR